MKLVTMAALAVVVAIAGCSDKEAVAASVEKQPAAEQVPAKKAVSETKKSELTLEQKVSYIIGFNMSSQMRTQKFEMDIDRMVEGINQGYTAKDSMFTPEESQKLMMEFQQKMQAKIVADREVIATKNLAESTAFLAENAKLEGVVVTDSGLQYKEITAGDGPKPVESDQVKVHYKGMLADGKVFDSSYERGEPAVFPVQGVIPGWIEALQLMNVGDKWEIAIPPAIAYGETGAGELIGPNAALRFEVELLAIESPEEAKPADAKPVDAEKAAD